MAAIPTVLVGLGGIGTEIVDRVYSMISDQERNRVAVHGFDTDVNDIEQRENLRGRITQISARMTVGRCYELVKEAGGTVEGWFPPLSTELARKPLTEGAAQVRAVSRLAYYHAMLTGKMQNLEKQVAEIFQNRAQEYETTPRIVIVSSLAGGTGAGIFLQTALYLRELLADYFDQDTVIVRGMFLLPDLLIKNGKLPPSQHDTVRANAYACLKELDAITRNASGVGGGVTIELEYRPNQRDLSIRRGQKPYDFCFLYDYANAAGRNLGQLSAYIEQVVQALYLQFFTPMGDNNRSQEDNNLRASINHQGTNCYCGAGVSRLVYPYESIVEYCTTRWIEESLSGQWRRLDDAYEDELKVFEQDMNQGHFRERPQRSKRYVEVIDSWGENDGGDPFFRKIYRSAFTLDEKGMVRESKMALFLEAVEKRIVTLLQRKEDLRDAVDACAMDDGLVKKKEFIAREVVRMEDNLALLQDTVFRVIDEVKNQVFNEILGSSCNAGDCLGGDEDHRLNVWLLRRKEPVHPVAVRYMLYRLELELEKKLNELNAANRRQEVMIRAYRNEAYDIKGTDLEETAEDRVRLAMEQSVFGKLLKNDMATFARYYRDRSQQQKDDLVGFANKRLMEKVFDALFKAVHKLNEQWENFFARLKNEQSKLLEKRIRLENQHTGHDDLSTIFVLAGKTDKEQAWDGMRLQITSQTDLPTDICQEMYTGVFHYFCREMFPWAERQSDERTGFVGILSAWCRAKVLEQNNIRLNLLAALKRSGHNMKNLISSVDNLAQPYISQPANLGGIAYWGIHPDCVNELSAAEAQASFQGSDNLLAKEAFSPFELIRYRVMYGLTSSDLPKFHGKPDDSVMGDYFGSYMKGVRDLQARPETAIPHHLDRRWHLPAYMPDLNPEIAKQDRDKSIRAFLYGLILNLLSVGTRDGRPVWIARMDGGAVRTPRVNGEYVAGGFYNLYQALSHNPVIVDAVLDAAEKIRTEDASKLKVNIPAHRFVLNAGEGFVMKSDKVANILDAIFSFVLERPGDSLVETTVEVLHRYIEEMRNYFVGVYGVHQRNTAQKSVADRLKNLRDTSVIYNDSQQDGNEFFTSWQGKIDYFLDQFNKNTH